MTLKNINLTIRKGEFVCIIGDVGSGKSSLLSSIIGDLLYLDSDFLKKYESWMLNDNNPELYNLVRDHSQKILTGSKAPIKIDGEIAYVQ